MNFIDPHIHMYSRTTDDYARMYHAGIRAVVEPSFWLGSFREHAGSYFDYFRHILDFECKRARNFAIDHYACIAMNPKEADHLDLSMEVLDGMGRFLDHERCVAVGEVGFNLITPNEEQVLQRQLEMAKKRNLLIMVHSPHDTPEVSKLEGIKRTIDILRELNYDNQRILMDHNTEETMTLTLDAGLWAGMSVYPYSKLNPERVVGILRRWGLEKTMINSAADWGVADPCNVANVAAHMRTHGFSDTEIQKLTYDNPYHFYRQSGRFEPDLELSFIDPSAYQR